MKETLKNIKENIKIDNHEFPIYFMGIIRSDVNLFFLKIYLILQGLYEARLAILELLEIHGVSRFSLFLLGTS